MSRSAQELASKGAARIGDDGLGEPGWLESGDELRPCGRWARLRRQQQKTGGRLSGRGGPCAPGYRFSNGDNSAVLPSGSSDLFLIRFTAWRLIGGNQALPPGQLEQPGECTDAGRPRQRSGSMPALRAAISIRSTRCWPPGHTKLNPALKTRFPTIGRLGWCPRFG